MSGKVKSTGREEFNPLDELDDLIETGLQVVTIGKANGERDLWDILRVSGPEYESWVNRITIFSVRFLKEHPLNKQLTNFFDGFDSGSISACESIIQILRNIRADEYYWDNKASSITNDVEESPMHSNKIFIVHGHDEGALQSVARVLEHAGFEPIILHEQPDGGNTIIEKIEKYTEVAFGIVLYTPSF